MCEYVWFPTDSAAAHNFSASAPSGFPSSFFALMNPYTEGTCRFFKIASTFAVVSACVTPGGNDPFRGRSSNVMASFCAAQISQNARRKVQVARETENCADFRHGMKSKSFISRVYLSRALQRKTWPRWKNV